MQKIKPLGAILFSALILFTSCDLPKSSPDFSVEQEIDLPLLNPKRYYMLGGSEAFIDTTAGGIDTLFTTNNNNVLFISFTDSVELGDLDDAIPSIDVDPSSIESEVGTIEVDDFSADFGTEVGTIEQSPEGANETRSEIGNIEPQFTGDGSASFLEVVGSNAPNVAAPIIAGSTTITIDLDAGEFNSALVESGGLAIDFTNSLGFTISSMNARLFSDANGTRSRVGSELQFTNITHTSTASGSIDFSSGDNLEVALQMEVDIDWANQTYQPNAINALSVSASDDNLVVTSATAELPGQDLSPSTPDIEVSDPGFSSVTLASDNEGGTVNQLVLTLQNDTNIPLSNAAFDGFPTIELRNSNGEVLDSQKEIRPLSPSGSFIGANETAEVVFDLAGQTLTKVLSYTIDLGTPGSQGSALQVNSTDAITINASTTNLVVEQASATIDAQSDISLADTTIIDGDFVQVVIDNGDLNLSFTNTMSIPIILESLTILNRDAFVAKNTGEYISAGTEIGTLENITIEPNATTTAVINLDGKALSDAIIFDATASSPGSEGSPVTITSSDLINIGVSGSIAVNSATARLKSQNFNSDDSLEIDRENFVFSSTSHYVELKSGELVISDLINELDVSLDTLKITIPSIVDRNEEVLEIGFYGNSQTGTIFPAIQRGESNTRGPVVIDLSNLRIKATNNQVSYSVVGITEDTELSSDPFRTIRSTDKVSASLEINNLEIGEALGEIIRKEVILGDDDASNGEDILDIMNDTEANVVENESLYDLSERLENLSLSGTELSINYTTNIGVQTEVFMAIAGTTSDGDLIFIKGQNELAVQASDSTDNLVMNGVPIDKEDLVKFSIGQSQSSAVSTYDGSITFNSNNSNVDEFLSELPPEIRTIGLAVVNPNQNQNSFVSNPIEFETELSIDLPLAISTDNDTLKINEDIGEITAFEDVPSEDDDITINEMQLGLTYTNNLPLALNVKFEFRDADSTLVTVDYEPIQINAAPVDNNGFTTGSFAGTTELVLSNATQLQEVERMSLIIEAQTSGGRTVRIRSTDFIEIGIKAKVKSNLGVN